MKTFADFGIEVHGSGAEVKSTCPQCSQYRKKRSYKCLNVNTEKGIWLCHHCGWSGGLGDGAKKPEPVKRDKVYAKPVFIRPNELPAKALEWFAKRGITAEVLEANKVGYSTVFMPQIGKETTAIQFPFYRDGEVVNIKSRDGLKNFRMEKDCERVLYGLDDLEEITIVVEGEIDKLSLDVVGLTNSVSVPDGAPAPDSKSYDTKFDFLNEPKLEGVKTFILAVDNDPPGKKLEEELARRLGRDRCMRVTWPDGCKDSNDVLVNHGADALRQCIADAVHFPVEGVFSVLEVATNIDSYYSVGMPKGVSTGWPTLDELYKPLPGLWTVVTGIPGSGKSEVLDGIMLNIAARDGWGFGVFSPENQPYDFHVSKLAEKLIGKPFRNVSPNVARMTRQELTDAMRWLDTRVHYILPEEPTLDAVLDRAKFLVRRKGIKGLIIDPWNEITHGVMDRETDYVSESLSKVRRFARANDVHVWIMAHPAKLHKDPKTGNYPIPSTYDISGSAHWNNKADYALAVHRDKSDLDGPVQVYVQKVRFKWTGKLGCADFKWDWMTGRFTDLGATQQSYPTVEQLNQEDLTDGVPI